MGSRVDGVDVEELAKSRTVQPAANPAVPGAVDDLMELDGNEDENQLLLDVEEEDMDMDLVNSNPGTRPSTVSMRTLSSGTPKSTKSRVCQNSLNTSLVSEGEFGLDISSEIDQDEIETILASSPEKKNSTRRIAPPLSSETHDTPLTTKVLVPVTIAGGCVQIRFDHASNRRSYYNDYYNRSIEMTNDVDLWNRVENDDFDENEERPDEIEITVPSKQQLVDLYRSLNLYSNQLEIPTMENVKPGYRLDSVLMRGVDGLSTHDVFLYLRTYNQIPVMLEWVNDNQCVAVFADEYDAGRCLLELSKRISPNTQDKPEDFAIDMCFDLVDEVPVNWVEVPVPPSHTWRFAVATFHDPKAKPGFLLTIAKKTDKKQANAEALSGYYREYGNPNWKEDQSLWTRNGFEKKMAKKNETLARKGKRKVPEGIPLPPPTRLDDPVDVDLSLNFSKPHVPIQDRLGSVPTPRKRKVVETSFEDEKEEGEQEDDEEEEDHRDQRRSRRDREDSSEDENNQRYTAKRSRGSLYSSAYHEDRATSQSQEGDEEGGRPRRWNGYEGGMVADAEEEVSRQRNNRRRDDDRGRGHWRDGPGRKPSVKDRLGW